jgi:hypothetical protein
MLRPAMLQGEQAPLLQLTGGQKAIGMAGFALQTEAANPHTNPLIQTTESVKHLGHTEIVGISSNDRVKVLQDSLDIPPLLSPGHEADTVFELLNGTRSDAKAEAAKVKPQELKALVKTREARFCLMERESEVPKDLLSVSHGESGFLWRFREDDEIISVSDVPPAFGFNLLVEGVEDNVGEQRGDDASLRSTLGGDADDAMVTNTGFEEGFEKTDDTAVCDPGTDAGYNNLVVNSVEEGGDICVDDVDEAIPCVPNCGCNSVVSLATWSEAETSIREKRIEDRSQDLIDRLLTHAVDYDGNTQRALLLGVRSLGDIDATDRMRYEAVFHELALQLSQMGFRIFFEGADSHPIESMGTLVGPDLAPSGPEVFPGVNFVDKRMGFKHRSPLACYAFATRQRGGGHVCCFDEPDSEWYFVSDHGPRSRLGVQGGDREQPEVTQARFPLFTWRTICGGWFSTTSWPNTSRPSATVNPHDCPACVRDDAPNRAVHGLGLNRDMLITPRRSKSRLHRQRMRAKFSHSLYRPLPSHCWPDAVSYSRGYHRLPSGSPTLVNTCRTAGLTCYLPTATLLRAPRYSVSPDMCALLPRHHSEPKDLLLADHFDDIPHGMSTGYTETTKSFRTGSKPARVSFTLLM